MEEKLFKQLVESVKEAGEIRKGKRKPSRVFQPRKGTPEVLSH